MVRYTLAVALLWVCTIQPSVALDQPIFGTYSQKYLDKQQLRKWKALCKGAGRYEAMREAYDAGKPDPCSSAKTWKR